MNNMFYGATAFDFALCWELVNDIDDNGMFDEIPEDNNAAVQCGKCVIEMCI